LLDLEKNGFEINISSKGKLKVFAVISQFTGDNLAINQIFGMTESFSHYYFCAMCYCIREESQENFLETDFQLRTQKSYEFDLEPLVLLGPGSLHYTGIKRGRVLNRLRNFNIFFKLGL